MRLTHAAAAFLALGVAFAARAEDTPTTPSTSSTTISGKTFIDYTVRQNKDDGTALADDKTGTALDIKRFYLTVDHSFDQMFSARIRTDAGNVAYDAKGKPTKFDVFVKHAYVQATIAPQLVLRAGSADLPWVPFAEELSGFRYVEPVVAERVKLATSADWGLHVSGKCPKGFVAYAVSVINGRGYADPTRTQSPTVEARISVVPVSGLTLALGAQVGKLGQNVVPQATPRTAKRFDALVAWVNGGLRAGAMGYVAKDDAAGIVTGTDPRDTNQGASVWASYELVSKLTAFGRLDMTKPKVHTASDEKDVYFNVGLQYEPVKALDVSLVYKRDQVDSGVLDTVNGKIGSAVAGETGTYNEVGVFAQYAF